MVTAQLLDQPPGCILTALRVRHEDADTCARKLAQLNEILVTFDGFASLDTIRREGGLGTDFYILARFRDVAALERWRALPDRNALMDEIEAMSIADVSRQQAAGSNIWFEPIVSMPSQPKPPCCGNAGRRACWPSIRRLSCWSPCCAPSPPPCPSHWGCWWSR